MTVKEWLEKPNDFDAGISVLIDKGKLKEAADLMVSRDQESLKKSLEILGFVSKKSKKEKQQEKLEGENKVLELHYKPKQAEFIADSNIIEHIKEKAELRVIPIELARQKSSFFQHRVQNANRLTDTNLPLEDAIELILQNKEFTQEMLEIRKKEKHFEQFGELPEDFNNTQSTALQIDKIKDPQKIIRLIRNARVARSKARNRQDPKKETYRPKKLATYRSKEKEQDMLIERLEKRLEEIS